MTHAQTLAAAGLTAADITGGSLPVHSPIDGAIVAHVRETPLADMPDIIARAASAFKAWREVPAPRRGELVRLLGEELRAAKAELGAVVTLEAGKITSEGLGEVQEMIDICDFAVGLSRQIYGLTIASERPGHRMMESWHPLGPCAVTFPWLSGHGTQRWRWSPATR
jgi:aldehyde dehydrogenase (NAD+)